MKPSFFIVILWALISCTQPNKQVSRKDSILNSNSEDKRLSYFRFKAMVVAASDSIHLPRKDFDSLQAIHWIKLFNTSWFYALQDSVFYRYQTFFLKNCERSIAKKWGCQTSIGFGLFCPEQNIYIGGASYTKNELYILQTNTLPKNTLFSDTIMKLRYDQIDSELKVQN